MKRLLTLALLLSLPISLSAQSITFIWSFCDGASSYNIYRASTGAFTSTLLASVGGATLTYTDKAVEAGKTYQYQIAAANYVGEGPRSSITLTAPPLQLSTLKATFQGQTVDKVGTNSYVPDGSTDWQFRATGLRGNPISVLVTTPAGGIWGTPVTPQGNWRVMAQYDLAGNSDLWISPSGVPDNGFHVKVSYADGTSDETDVSGVLDPCYMTPLLISGVRWPLSRTGTKSFTWNSSSTPIVAVSYSWPIGKGQTAVLTDDRGCTWSGKN